MIKFYFNMSPNPIKVALYLEEAGIEYEAHPVDARAGHQHKADYRAINPNGKVPAIVDGDATVFDSNAILLYLGEKTGKFMPADKSGKTRGEFLSWLMFIASGVGPFSGQAVHFKHFSTEDVAYAKNRYSFEADRHYTIPGGSPRSPRIHDGQRIRRPRHGAVRLDADDPVHHGRGSVAKIPEPQAPPR